MKNLKIIFFLLSLIIITGIGVFIVFSGNKTEVNLSNIRDLPENSPENGFGIGMYKTFDAIAHMNSTQYINNDNLSGYFEIFNSYNESNQFLIIVLLDYQEIAFTYNNITNSTHLVNVSSKKGLINPFYVTGITPGYHDLIFLVIMNPNDYYNNITFKNPITNNTSTNKVWNRFPAVCNTRFNIIYKNEEEPLHEYGNIINEKNQSLNYSDMFLTKEPMSNDIWMFENTSENETIPYYINIANDVGDNASYVVIPMLDYEQIPISKTLANKYYGHIEKNEVCSIPADIRTPLDNGIHVLIVFFIPDPFKKVEIGPGQLNPEVNTCINALRTGINVI
jgi:hypothetical protein